MNESGKFTIEILVNEQPIKLNNFTSELIKNLIYAVISSLKLEAEPKNIDIKLKS